MADNVAQRRPGPVRWVRFLVSFLMVEAVGIVEWLAPGEGVLRWLAWSHYVLSEQDRANDDAGQRAVKRLRAVELARRIDAVIERRTGGAR